MNNYIMKYQKSSDNITSCAKPIKILIMFSKTNNKSNIYK
jgi:hypothetical protein